MGIEWEHVAIAMGTAVIAIVGTTMTNGWKVRERLTALETKVDILLNRSAQRRRADDFNTGSD